MTTPIQKARTLQVWGLLLLVLGIIVLAGLTALFTGQHHDYRGTQNLERRWYTVLGAGVVGAVPGLVLFATGRYQEWWRSGALKNYGDQSSAGHEWWRERKE